MCGISTRVVFVSCLILSGVLFEWSCFFFVYGPHSGFVRGSRSWTGVGFVLRLFVSRALFECTGVFLDYGLHQVVVRHGRSLACAVFVAWVCVLVYKCFV